jgi:hypothetical protein
LPSSVKGPLLLKKMIRNQFASESYSGSAPRLREDSSAGRDLALEPLHGGDRLVWLCPEGDDETVGARGAKRLDPTGDLVRRPREGRQLARLVAQASTGDDAPLGPELLRLADAVQVARVRVPGVAELAGAADAAA